MIAGRHGWLPGAGILAGAISLVLLAGYSPPVLANGGTVQLSNQRTGNYRVTVFTSPSPNPIPVGIVDVSVLLQRGEGNDLVENARVTVHAEPGWPCRASRYLHGYPRQRHQQALLRGQRQPSFGRRLAP